MTADRVDAAYREARPEDISGLQKRDQQRILDFLENRLALRENPRELGEALTGPLAGLWKYRVGAFRIVARIEDRLIAIWVVRVGNRREVYRSSRPNC